MANCNQIPTTFRSRLPNKLCLNSLWVTRVTQFKSEFDFFKLAVMEDVQLLDVLANLDKQDQ